VAVVKVMMEKTEAWGGIAKLVSGTTAVHAVALGSHDQLFPGPVDEWSTKFLRFEQAAKEDPNIQARQATDSGMMMSSTILGSLAVSSSSVQHLSCYIPHLGNLSIRMLNDREVSAAIQAKEKEEFRMARTNLRGPPHLRLVQVHPCSSWPAAESRKTLAH
jgi:hypothetical protein